MNPYLVDQAVCGATGIIRENPVRFVLQKGIDLLLGHIEVAIEIDDLDLAEDPPAGEDRGIHVPGHRVADLVICHARIKDVPFDGRDVKTACLEVRSQPRLEQLTAGQTADDDGYSLRFRGIEACRIHCLEAAVTHVAVSSE